LRDKVEQNNPEAVVLNIEYWRLTDVESLHRDFPKLPVTFAPPMMWGTC
jgi:hypothetical protein